VSFFPALAWDGAGWATDRRREVPGSASPTADFDVRVVKPRRVRVLATGDEVRPGVWHAEAVRDFALALGSFQVRTATVRLPEPVRVTVGIQRGSATTTEQYMRWTADVLRSYAERFSGYPWPAYTLAVMPDIDNAGPDGFAFPTLSFVGGTEFNLIAHESAHQWFYSLVGENDARDPWLAEGLATWAESGPEQSLPVWLTTPIPAAVRNRIGEPASFWERFPFETVWHGLYLQPVQALATLGEPEAVDCALRAYVVRNAYRNVLPRDLFAALTSFFPDAEEKLRARGARF
jgi:Peptidase family M1 domain